MERWQLDSWVRAAGTQRYISELRWPPWWGQDKKGVQAKTTRPDGKHYVEAICGDTSKMDA